MKCILCLVSLFISTIVYCQDSYVFDHILEYEIQKPSESVRKDVEKRLYLINTKDNSYVAIAIEREDGTYTLVFRDDKKDKIAELRVSENAVIDTNELRIKKKFLTSNRYTNPVFVDDYLVSITPKDSLIEVYTYTYKRRKIHNRYKTKRHVIVVDKSVDYFMPGVGFGDYYSLLTWGEKFPIGLVKESLTERLDGSIVSHSILSKTSDYHKVFIFE